MVIGGAGLGTSLLELVMVDEVRFTIHPVILSGSKPMFPVLKQPLLLQLIETRQFQGAVILLRYQCRKSQG